MNELARLDADKARALTDEVKRDAQALWRKLIELHEGGAHTALNYPNWHEYCAAEFGFGRAHSYRLLDAGRVTAAIPQLENEAQAREFAPLLRAEDEGAVTAVYAELKAEHGDQLTAERVRAAVEDRTATNGAAPRDAVPVSEEDFQRAVTDALTAFGWRWVHFRPARTAQGWRTALSGSPGYPDISAVRGDRILFVELKAANGKLRDEQRDWLGDLGAAGAEVHCWRPSDWPLIEGLLR